MNLIPEEHHDKLEIGKLFIVKRNVNTKHVKDLYFVEFEVAPDPDPDDGLAHLVK